MAITYDDFQKGRAAFEASCEAAATPAERLSLVLARAQAAAELPPEIVVRRKKSRLTPLVEAIAKVAGDGYSRPRDRRFGELVRTSDWAQAIVDRAEAELAERPAAERCAVLFRRRRAAYSEPKDKDKRDALYREMKARAPAIDSADYPLTPMDAAAHQAADNLHQRLWSAPQERPGRNTVASRRFQLPLRPSIDLGHLVDALRDGLSFLIPTSAIEVLPLEHYVKKMEHGAKIHPHLYPPARE